MTANTVRMTIESDSAPSQQSPKPYEIASIAAQLSNGKNPEKHLSAAINLYWAARRELEDDYVADCNHDNMVAYQERDYQFKQKNVLFDTNSDWDGLREYLQGKMSRPLKKAQSVRDNLNEFFNETGQHEKARTLKLRLSSGKTHIPKSILDEFISFKKRRKSEGGKKSHRTRQNGPAPATTAKK
jgi:hypothetical protein